MTGQQETNIGISSSESFPGVRAAIVKQMLAASDEMNVEKSLSFCTDDVLYKFGNWPIIQGKQGIQEASASFLQNFKSLKHNIKSIWEIGDTVVVKMEVNYLRNDNQTFTLPCCNIFRIKGEMVQEMLIYMDISPVFA